MKADTVLDFENLRCGACYRATLIRGGAYFKVREMNNIKCQNLAIYSFKVRMKDILWKSKTRVTSSNPRVTSSNPRVTSSRVGVLKARAGVLKARVGRLKA